MSIFRLIKPNFFGLYSKNQSINNSNIEKARNFSISLIKYCEPKPIEENKEDNAKSHLDRTKVIPVETSVKYLASEAYKETYGTEAVWVQYRRNHKGIFPRRKTRKTCIRQGHISTGNPCPICRDEFLVLDHRNLDLLNQFISPHSGEIISYTKTGLCQKKHEELLIAVQRAMDYGLLTFDVPFREFDYSEFYDQPVTKSN